MRLFQLLAGKSRVNRDTLISVFGAKCHGISNRVRDVRCHDTKPQTYMRISYRALDFYSP